MAGVVVGGDGHGVAVACVEGGLDSGGALLLGLALAQELLEFGDGVDAEGWQGGGAALAAVGGGGGRGRGFLDAVRHVWVGRRAVACL